ncbi:hypothetical protein [Rhizobium jaguaris]|uniref:Uncharacterized protein n=1 Tax=Rhizobium jaguaris TaxID=1312183 RepID=A0A387G8A2_9HYPH|nr:hypothetical protein [Rhizobium jaguaris]AYG64072.1 hypothetical protein CCGE525_35260 [Rhizobium jaguaris]
MRWIVDQASKPKPAEPSIATEERETLKDEIAIQARDAILDAYTVTEIEQEERPRATEINGWTARECIKGDEKPRYKWRHTWAGEKGDDIVGCDCATCLGCVFRLDYTAQSAKWFWLVELYRLSDPIADVHRQDGSGVPERQPVAQKNAMKRSCD